MTDTNRHVTLGRAAKLVGVSRPTIYRYAKEGKLTVSHGVGGTKLVDLAELARLFPDFKPDTPENETVTGSDTTPLQPVRQSQKDTPGLDWELHAAKREADFYRQEVDRLRQRETDLLDLVKSHTLLLEHKPEPVTPPSSPTTLVLVAIMLSMVLVALAKVLGFLG